MEKKDGKLKNGRGEWYKLDLSAIVYPTLQRSGRMFCRRRWI